MMITLMTKKMIMMMMTISMIIIANAYSDKYNYDKDDDNADNIDKGDNIDDDNDDDNYNNIDDDDDKLSLIKTNVFLIESDTQRRIYRQD